MSGIARGLLDSCESLRRFSGVGRTATAALATTLDDDSAHCEGSRAACSSPAELRRFAAVRRGACAHVIMGRERARFRPVRRPRRRRGTLGRGDRALARGAWSSRPRGREEALSPREDLRRRAHAASGAPAARHGPRGPARRSSSASTDCARSRTASPSSSPGPSTRTFPSYGYVVRRRELDEMVADAGGQGGRDRVAGRGGGRTRRRRRPARRARWCATPDTGAVDEVRARYVVVADGANSRFGRALGTSRRPDLPARDGDPRLFHEPAATTSRGSRATSTSATETATICPDTAGSSRLATAP